MEVRVEEAGGGDDGGQDEVAGEDFLRVSATGKVGATCSSSESSESAAPAAPKAPAALPCPPSPASPLSPSEQPCNGANAAPTWWIRGRARFRRRARGGDVAN